MIQVQFLLFVLFLLTPVIFSFCHCVTSGAWWSRSTAFLLPFGFCLWRRNEIRSTAQVCHVSGLLRFVIQSFVTPRRPHGKCPDATAQVCHAQNGVLWGKIRLFQDIIYLPTSSEVSAWASERTNECSGARERSEQCGESEWVNVIIMDCIV